MHIHDFSNIFITYYYHKLINIPTRERKHSSTLLDNIFNNIPDFYDSGMSGVLRFLTQSDHFPIFTMMNNVLTHEPIKYANKQFHNQQNIALFKTLEVDQLDNDGCLSNKTNISIVYNVYGYYSTIFPFRFSLRKENNKIQKQKPMDYKRIKK